MSYQGSTLHLLLSPQGPFSQMSSQPKSENHVSAARERQSTSTPHKEDTDVFARILPIALLCCVVGISAIILILGYTPDSSTQLHEGACKPECPHGFHLDEVQMPACTWTCLSYTNWIMKLVPSVIAGTVTVGLLVWAARDGTPNFSLWILIVLGGFWMVLMLFGWV